MCVLGTVNMRVQVLEESRKGHFDSLELELQNCEPVWVLEPEHRICVRIIHTLQLSGSAISSVPTFSFNCI